MKDIKQFALTDKGNADRLVHHFEDRIRYVTEIRSFYAYDRGVWRPDNRGRVVEYAKQIAERIAGEAQCLPDDLPDKELQEAQTALAQWAHKSESRERIRAMVHLAASDPRVVVEPADLDSHPYLFNVLNGTLDLEQCRPRPHRIEDLLTKCANARRRKGAQCPEWRKFLERVLPDAEVRSFVRRVAGYCLTGDISEHCFFLLYGTGRNGKSTFLRVLQYVLGDYARAARVQAFLMGRYDNTYYDLATLFGARFVWAAEPPQGSRLNEALLKGLTGGDPIQARFMRQDFFEYVPTFKLFLAANNKPTVTEANEGFWSRVRLIPFEVQIPERERDSKLFEKLVAECDGILNWMIAGYMEYRRQGGTNPPPAVMAATEEYRADSDALGQFLAECTVPEPNARTSRKALYEAYSQWCENNGETVGTQTEFTQRIKERGGFREHKYNGTYCWRDITVKFPPSRRP